MAALFTLAELKAQLNIVDDVDDALLGRLSIAAKAFVEDQLGYEIDERYPPTAGDPPSTMAPEAIRQAGLMLAGHWYENREATLVGMAGAAAPLGFDAVIANYRNYSFGASDDE